MGFKSYSNRAQMTASGWKFSEQTSQCRNCSATITWAKSPRSGKNVPFDGLDSTVSHFETCASTTGRPANGNATQPLTQPAQQDSNTALELRQAVLDLTAAVRQLTVVIQARASEGVPF